MSHPNYPSYDYASYSPPSDGEFRVRKVRRGWIVAVYSYEKPKTDPVVEEAIEKLRGAQDSWDKEESLLAASDVLHAKTYGAYRCQHDTLVKAETVFERAEDLVSYVAELASTNP